MRTSDEPEMSGVAVFAGLATAAVLLWQGVPVVWRFFLTTFWWDDSLSRTGFVMWVWAAVVTAAAAIVMMIAVLCVASFFEFFIKAVRRGHRLVKDE